MAISLKKNLNRLRVITSKPQLVKINSVEIEAPNIDVKLAIRTSQKPGFHSSKKWLFEELSEQLPFLLASLKDETLLYYRFIDESGDNEILLDEDNTILSISIKEYKSLLKRYLNEKIRATFRRIEGALTNPNFINDIEILIPSFKKNEHQIQVYDCFSIRVQLIGPPLKIKLIVYYTGEKACFMEAYEPLSCNHETATRFKYRTTFISIATLHNTEYSIDYKEVNPFLSKEQYLRYNVIKAKSPTRNVVSEHIVKITDFVETYLKTDAFEGQVGKIEAVFQEVEESELFEVDDEDKLVRFWGNQTAMLPKIGFKEYGPYQKGITKPVELIIIKPEGYEKEAEAIVNRLFDSGNFSLSNLTKLNIKISKHKLDLQNVKQPETELTAFFKQLPRNPDVQFFAIYLSPFTKSTLDKDEFEAYYKIKESLLSFDIPSQSIELRHFDNSSFTYFIPNIACAMIAKLGGTPWVINKPAIDGIVIGLTALSEKVAGERSNQFYGSTFCFNSDGRFLDFDAFTPQELPLLCGAIKLAISEYQKLEKEIKHVVIHLNQNLKFNDAVAIEETLKEMKVDVPVYLVRIAKQYANDVIVYDSERSHNMLPTGTYTKIAYNTFLLATNEFIDEEGKQSKYPFPIKIRLSKLNKEELSEDEIQKLITQVYQFSKLNFRTISTTPFPVTISYTEALSKMSYHFNQRKLDLSKKNQLFML